MAALTLIKMDNGGIHDQIGGGFHRYSTDRQCYPTALSEMLLALQFQLSDPLEVILVTPCDMAQADVFMDVLRETYAPAMVISVVAEGDQLRSNSAWLSPLGHKTARGGRPTAYVCRQGACRLPVTDPRQLMRELTGALEGDEAADPAK